MAEDIHKGIDFYGRTVEINSMAMAWDVSDVCDKEVIPDAIKHHKGYRYFKCRWKNVKKSLFDQLMYILKLFFTLTTIVTTLETEVLGKIEFWEQHIFTFKPFN